MGSKAEKEEEEEEGKMSMSMSMPRTPGRKIHQLPSSSPARSGMQTPPFHPPASVPFRWEQEPGKPWPCSALVFVPAQPRDFSTSLPAPPPTVPLLLQPPRLQAPSFRMSREDPLPNKRWRRGDAWFGLWSWRRKQGINGKAEVYVFPSVDCGFEGEENGGRRMRMRSRSRSGSGSSFPILPHPKSHFWVSQESKVQPLHLHLHCSSLWTCCFIPTFRQRNIYQGLKGAIPWRGRTSNKNTAS